MACHSCSGFEHFTNNEEHESSVYQETPKKCSVKEGASKCLYTAQGVFLCVREDKPDMFVKNTGIVDNESILMDPFQTSNKFKDSAPW